MSIEQELARREDDFGQLPTTESCWSGLSPRSARRSGLTRRYCAPLLFAGTKSRPTTGWLLNFFSLPEIGRIGTGVGRQAPEPNRKNGRLMIGSRISHYSILEKLGEVRLCPNRAEIRPSVETSIPLCGNRASSQLNLEVMEP